MYVCYYREAFILSALPTFLYSVKKRISVNSLVPQNELTLLFTSSQEETLATGHHLVCFGSHIHAIYFKGHEDRDAGYIKVDRDSEWHSLLYLGLGTKNSSIFRLGDSLRLSWLPTVVI